jgi:hypothetical protein
MPNWKNIAIGTGATVVVIGGASYLLKMSRTNAELEIVNRVILHKIDLTGLYIKINSTLKNPTKGSFNIKFPFVKLLYKDSTIGTSQSINKDIPLPAYGEAQINDILVNIPFLGLFSLGFKVFKALKDGQGVAMQLKTITTIDLGWRTLPYENVEDITIKK